MAMEQREYKAQIAAAQSADDITVMIVPRGISFRRSIDQDHLREVSCIFKVNPKQSKLFYDLISDFSSDIVRSDNDNPQKFDFRIGMLFRLENKIVETIFLEDSGEGFDSRGIFGNRKIEVRAGVTTKIRDMSHSPGFVLQNNTSYDCK